jgi:DNA-binding cell septation regulator SpoVG
MEDITIFNLRAVHKGALKATVSIRLGSGLIIHDCKIIQQDGVLSAALPQRAERQKGGEVVYHDLVEFADWPRSRRRPLYTLVTSAIGKRSQDNPFKINILIFFNILFYAFISH